MKKILFTSAIVILFLSCEKYTDIPGSDTNVSSDCGYHNGKPLHLGSVGGCYYINSNGNKKYVSRSECKCD